MRSKATRLTIFNHKGGVGKTTLTVHIGAALAAQGKRVLLVDSDPQCNLTSYLLSDDVVDELLDESGTTNGRTVWTAVSPIVDGENTYRPIEPYEPGLKNFYLFPGDIRLSEYELLLNDLWTDCFKRYPRGYRGTTALSALINDYTSKHNIDYVFYDAGPNVGPLNRVIFLDCDFFIIPAACDLFSIRGLKTLGRTVSSWVTDWKMLTGLAPNGAYLFPGTPRFLGYVPQRFRTYSGSMTSVNSTFFSRFQKAIASDVVAELRKVEKTPQSTTSTSLGAVKDFASLVQLSQDQGVPMWRVDGGSQALKQHSRVVFNTIADNVISRTTG